MVHFDLFRGAELLTFLGILLRKELSWLPSSFLFRSLAPLFSFLSLVSCLLIIILPSFLKIFSFEESMRQSRIWFWLVIFLSLISFSNSFANGEKSIPSIEIILDEVRSAFPKKERTKSLVQMLFETKKFYYQIQYQKQ